MDKNDVYDTGLMIADMCIAGKIRKLDRFITGIYDRELKNTGIRITQAVMLVLLVRGGRGCSGIGRALLMDKSTVSRNVERMRKNGWVRMTENQTVEITQEGLDLVISVKPAWERAQAAVSAILKDDGVDAVDLLLRRIDENNKR